MLAVILIGLGVLSIETHAGCADLFRNLHPSSPMFKSTTESDAELPDRRVVYRDKDGLSGRVSLWGEVANNFRFTSDQSGRSRFVFLRLRFTKNLKDYEKHIFFEATGLTVEMYMRVESHHEARKLLDPVLVRHGRLSDSAVKITRVTDNDAYLEGLRFFSEEGKYQVRVTLPEKEDMQTTEEFLRSRAQNLSEFLNALAEQYNLEIHHRAFVANRIGRDFEPASLGIYENSFERYDTLRSELANEREGEIVREIGISLASEIPGERVAGVWLLRDFMERRPQILDEYPVLFNALSEIARNQGEPEFVAKEVFRALGEIPASAVRPAEWLDAIERGRVDHSQEVALLTLNLMCRHPFSFEEGIVKDRVDYVMAVGRYDDHIQRSVLELFDARAKALENRASGKQDGTDIDSFSSQPVYTNDPYKIAQSLLAD